MWLEKLKLFSEKGPKGPLKYLDLKFELHNAIYMIETLEDIFEFTGIISSQAKMNEL